MGAGGIGILGRFQLRAAPVFIEEIAAVRGES
jgi:hypothetical protein